MKEQLYLNNLKNKLNKDQDSNFIYDESQTGPQEEPTLIQYEVDINQFKKYLKEKKKQ